MAEAYDFPDYTSKAERTAPEKQGGVKKEEEAGVQNEPDISGKTRLVLVKEENCRGRIKGSGNRRMCLEENCRVQGHHGSSKVFVPSRGLVF